MKSEKIVLCQTEGNEILTPAFFPVWLLASGALNADGEYYSKIWANKPSIASLFIVAAAYSLSGIVWLPALLHENKLSVMGTAWLLTATVSTLIIGVFVFKEDLTLIQWTGVGLSILALALLTIKY